MQTTMFSGVDLAAAILDEVRPGIEDGLCVLADPASPGATAYINRITEFAQRIALPVKVMGYPENDDAAARFLKSCKTPILPLQPPPDGIDVQALLDRIGPERDVEGVHPVNAGRLALGQPGTVPPTAEAATIVARHLAGSLEGAVVSVIGASFTVGRPLALLLLNCGATVRVSQATTRDLAAETREADIVIAATGVPGLVGADHLRRGAIAIDVGIRRVGDRLVGDIDQAAVDGRAAWVTLVPDGVGPITTACLLRNTVNACRKLGL